MHTFSKMKPFQLPKDFYLAKNLFDLEFLG